MNLGDLITPELPKPVVTCTVEGILDEDDLRELAITSTSDIRVQEDDPTDLKKLKEKHHSVARLIASGMQQRMVAHISGYTEGYISILMNAPAFAELVELYRIQSGAAAAVITEKLQTVGMKALEKLDAKIEADELNALELTSAAKLGLDRSGHGPQSKQHVVNEDHIIDHARLKELNENARRRDASYIVPSSEVRKALEGPKK